MAGLVCKFKYLKPHSKKKRGGYIKYIATRDGVEIPSGFLSYMDNRPRSHGLFSYIGDEISLEKVSKEIDEHDGNVYTMIFSLKREDAERLGYNSSEDWQRLLNFKIEEISRNCKIDIKNLRWYAAFHDESYHPHIHMVVYSSDPNEGYLTKKGVENIKHSLAKDIFKEELEVIYQAKTAYRDLTKAQAEVTLKRNLDELNIGRYNPKINELMEILAVQLRRHKGKKVYGFLPKDIKATVDTIFEELADDECISSLYSLWYREKENEMLKYRTVLPERIDLQQNKEFRSIKNMIIKAALPDRTVPEEYKGSVLEEYIKQQRITVKDSVIDATYKLIHDVGYAVSPHFITEGPVQKNASGVDYNESLRLYGDKKHYHKNVICDSNFEMQL